MLFNNNNNNNNTTTTTNNNNINIHFLFVSTLIETIL